MSFDHRPWLLSGWSRATGLATMSGHPRGRAVGARRTTWEELELVARWNVYLDAPGRYLRYVLAD